MLHHLIAASADRFWWPEKSEDMENPDFENLNYLQKPGTLLQCAPCIKGG